jgi:hypothetical protein
MTLNPHASEFRPSFSEHERMPEDGTYVSSQWSPYNADQYYQDGADEQHIEEPSSPLNMLQEVFANVFDAETLTVTLERNQYQLDRTIEELLTSMNNEGRPNDALLVHRASVLILFLVHSFRYEIRLDKHRQERSTQSYF